MRKREKNTYSKALIVIVIFLVLIILAIVAAITIKNGDENELENQSVLTRTLDVEGKEAKYTLLENEDGTVYAIQFENWDVMTEVNLIKRKGRQNIKDEIDNKGIYKFKEDHVVYKLEIETTNGIKITTDTFNVASQK